MKPVVPAPTDDSPYPIRITTPKETLVRVSLKATAAVSAS